MADWTVWTTVPKEDPQPIAYATAETPGGSLAARLYETTEPGRHELAVSFEPVTQQPLTVGADVGRVEGEPRPPTLLEIRGAVDALLLPGTLMGVAPFEAVANRPADPGDDSRPWAMILATVGMRGGSQAALALGPPASPVMGVM